VALIAAALNDPERSHIGDPRCGSYAVSLIATDAKEARSLESALKSLDLVVKTDHRLPPGATTAKITVNVHDPGHQRRLLRALEERLDPERRELLDLLVRSRGSIPAQLLEQIKHQHTGRETLEDIADVLNSAGVIDGMKGKHWSAYRLQTALN
jgi:hypothetical protein